MKPLTSSQRASLEMATKHYHQQLMDTVEAHRYLDSRGITMQTAIDFRLGFVASPIDDNHRRFQGMHLIPNLSGADDQHVVGLKFRDVRPDAPKRYDQPAHQVARLFNLRALSQADSTIWVTEGEYDAVILGQAGLPAVAVPGANHLGSSHRYRLRIFEGLSVVLCRDNDDAGMNLARAMHELPELAVRVPPKDIKDVNELWLKNRNTEALRAWAMGIDST